MTIVSLTDCCRLLAIDAKTLRRWLSLAHISVQAHPLDARLKCVTWEQVQQVAATHRRILPESSEQHFQAEPSPLSTPPDGRSASVLASMVSDVSAHIMDLTQQLGSPQAHVATLQHQLSLLTEQLQKEQEWRTSHVSTFKDRSPESSQDESLESSQDESLESSQDKSLESSQDKESAPASTHSASIDRRKHPHVLPLVEYGTQGKYVVISPERGRLSFEPDSPEWFAWLSTLPSFRFVGQHGRFTAFRGYQCSPSTPWWAHRQIRNHSHKHRLGTTASVTIECLELAATSLQALVK
jgi:hypothetical protein